MDKGKQRSVKSVGINLLMINAFVYVALSVYQPYLSAYYTSEGLTASEIGIILAIGPIVSILIQPIWARISDRTGRRKDIFSLVALGAAIAILTPYLGHSFGVYFISTFLFSSFTMAIIPLSDAIIVQQAHKYHLDYAKLRMGGTIGWSITVYLGGLILNVQPSFLFIMGSMGYLAMFLLARWLPAAVNEQKHPAVYQSEPAVKDAGGATDKPKEKGFLGVFKTPECMFVLALAFINQVGLQFNTGYLGMYVVSIGQPQSTIGILNSISALSEIPILICINKMSKKFGAIRILIFACIMLSLRIFLVTLGVLPAFMLAQAMQGLTYMTVHFCCVAWIYDNVLEGRVSQGQSMLAMLQMGAGAILGSILGGFVVDNLGLKTAYLTISGCVLTLTLLLAVAYYFFSRKRNRVIQQ
ncbi:MFS transporter [Anaerolentibacter hominis]|uniref:MFS transporter n=1 Tax=Anaerolentibacter hominis TaxID=3079009 RepID=UPI0031B7F578